MQWRSVWMGGREEEAGLDPHEDHVAFARLLGAVQKRYCILLFMRLQRDTNHGVARTSRSALWKIVCFIKFHEIKFLIKFSQICKDANLDFVENYGENQLNNFFCVVWLVTSCKTVVALRF